MRIISSSLRLLWNMWIWYRCQNRKLYHLDGKQLLFYKKYLSKHRTKWRLFLNSGSRPWTRTLDPNPEKPRPWKTWTQKNLDSEKPGPWKTWTVKNMGPEKHGINLELKNMSDFRQLCFIKTMLNVICTNRFVY